MLQKLPHPSLGKAISKNQALQVALVKFLKNLLVDMPNSVSVDDYDAMIIWCEQFSAFIISARLS